MPSVGGPKVSMAIAGKAAMVPTDAMPRIAAGVLNKLEPDSSRALRGTKSVQIYRQVAPAVVLVATEDGLGSGSLITTKGDIVTNWHVKLWPDHVGCDWRRIGGSVSKPTAFLREDLA
jgi:hypothetical protein